WFVKTAWQITDANYQTTKLSNINVPAFALSGTSRKTLLIRSRVKHRSASLGCRSARREDTGDSSCRQPVFSRISKMFFKALETAP
ncbi:hypothetical protein CGZ80_06150, partial [Rhodopirellula sp. MGV]